MKDGEGGGVGAAILFLNSVTRIGGSAHSEEVLKFQVIHILKPALAISERASNPRYIWRYYSNGG
jgi:hypothetical protein